MRSSFSLSRHDRRYHINITMREHTVWHVSITSEIKHGYTQKRLKYFASVEDDGILNRSCFSKIVSVMSAEMKTAHCARRGEEEALLSSLWQCAVNDRTVSVWVCPPTRQAPSAWRG